MAEFGVMAQYVGCGCPPFDKREVVESGLPEPQGQSSSSGEELDGARSGVLLRGHVVWGSVREPRISRM